MDRQPRRPSVRARCILVDGDGNVLMQLEDEGVYSIPGGKVEFDEDLAYCAVREFIEETRMRVYPERLVYIVEFLGEKGGRRKHEILFYFKCRYEGGSIKPPRKMKLEWVDPREVKGSFWPAPLLDRIIRDMPEFRNSYFMIFREGSVKYINTLGGH